MKSGLRGAIVVVAICAWFAISNHCVFAALATNSTPSRECPFHSKPKEKPSLERSAAKSCAQLLRFRQRAGLAMTRNLSDADAYRDECAFTSAYSQPTLVPLSLDTGPPRVRSFAELILQRSLLAHAPPSLA